MSDEELKRITVAYNNGDITLDEWIAATGGARGKTTPSGPTVVPATLIPSDVQPDVERQIKLQALREAELKKNYARGSEAGRYIPLTPEQKEVAEDITSPEEKLRYLSEVSIGQQFGTEPEAKPTTLWGALKQAVRRQKRGEGQPVVPQSLAPPPSTERERIRAEQMEAIRQLTSGEQRRPRYLSELEEGMVPGTQAFLPGAHIGSPQQQAWGRRAKWIAANQPPEPTVQNTPREKGPTNPVRVALETLARQTPYERTNFELLADVLSQVGQPSIPYLSPSTLPSMTEGRGLPAESEQWQALRLASLWGEPGVEGLLALPAPRIMSAPGVGGHYAALKIGEAIKPMAPQLRDAAAAARVVLPEAIGQVVDYLPNPAGTNLAGRLVSAVVAKSIDAVADLSEVKDTKRSQYLREQLLSPKAHLLPQGRFSSGLPLFPMTFGEATLGIYPHERDKLAPIGEFDDKMWGTQWLWRSMRRVQDGRGLPDDLRASAILRFGDDAESIEQFATLMGGVADVTLPFEWWLKVPHGLLKLGKAAHRLSGLALPGSDMESLGVAVVAALKHSAPSLADALMPAYIREIARDKLHLSHLDPEEAVALRAMAIDQGLLDDAGRGSSPIIDRFFREVVPLSRDPTTGDILPPVNRKPAFPDISPLPGDSADLAMRSAQEGGAPMDLAHEGASTPARPSTVWRRHMKDAGATADVEIDFMRLKPRSMAEAKRQKHYWTKDMHPSAGQLGNRHAGANALIWLQTAVAYAGRTPPRSIQVQQRDFYRLRDGRGKLVKQGSLQDLLDLMERRQQRHDLIQWENLRDVAKWTKRDSHIGSSYDFATKHEHDLIIERGMKYLDPEEAAQFLKDFERPKVARGMTFPKEVMNFPLDVLGAMVGGVRPGPVPALTGDRAVLANLVKDALTVRARHIWGSSHLVPYANGTHLVTRAELPHLQAEEARALRQAGIKNVGRQNKLGHVSRPYGEMVDWTTEYKGVDAPLQLTKEQKEALYRLGSRYGRPPYDPARPTTKDQRDIMDAMRGEIAGFNARAKYAWQGMDGGFIQRCMSVLEEPWLAAQRIFRSVDQTISHRAANAAHGGVFSNFLLGTDVSLADPSVQRVIKSITNELESISSTVFHDIDSAVRSLKLSRRDALRRAVGDFIPVTRQEVELATSFERIMIQNNGLDKTRIMDMRAEILDTMRGDLPANLRGLLHNDEEVVLLNIKRWAMNQHSTTRALLIDAVASYLPNVRMSQITRAVDELGPWRQAEAYQGWVLDGGEGLAAMFQGQLKKPWHAIATTSGLGEVKKEPEAMFSFLARQKSKSVARERFHELWDKGLAIPLNKEMRENLNKFITGIGGKIDEQGRRAFQISETEMGRMDAILRKLRIRPGWDTRWTFADDAGLGGKTRLEQILMGEAPVAGAGSGVPFAAAKPMLDEFRRAQDIGLSMAGAKLGEGLLERRFAKAWESFSTGVTAMILGGGPVVPRLAYLTNQASAVAFTASQMDSFGAFIRTTAHGLKLGALTGELTRRISHYGVTFGAELPAGRTLIVNGRIHTVDDLERIIRKQRVDVTRSSSETARKFFEDLERNEGPLWNRILRDHVLKLRRDEILELGELPERWYRISKFLYEYEKGASEALAAQRARDSLMSYTDLSPIDRLFLRRVFGFWTFMRKNLDSFWRVALSQPHRVGRQVRAGRDLLKVWGLSTEQQRDQKDLSRLILWRDTDVVDENGNPHPTYGPLLQMGSKVLNPIEAAMLFNRLFTDPLGLVGELQHPVFNMGLTLYTGVDPESGYTVEDVPRANIVPQFIVNFFPFAYELFGITPMPAKPEKGLDPTFYNNQGHPTLNYAQNWRTWQLFKGLLAPSLLRSMDRWDRGTQYQYPLLDYHPSAVPPHVTQEAMFLEELGAPRRPIRRDEAIQGRAARSQGFDIGAARQKASQEGR